MARGDQLSRQWKIIHTLIASSYGKTVPDLAQALDCTRRTVYRDLEALQAGGFPITAQTRDNHSYWRIMNASRQKVPLAFSIPELMALYFGRDMLKTYRGTVFYDAIESLLSKIKATLPSAYIDYLDRIQDKVDAMVADYPICVVSVFRYPDKGLVSLITPLTYEPIGIALNPNDTLLLNWVENFVNARRDSGDLEILKDRWFGDASWLYQIK